MTLAPALWRRSNPAFEELRLQCEPRVFTVEDGIGVLTQCHWQTNAKSAPTLVIIHGLEGSAESTYVLGISAKAFHFGMNVVRMNLRNCGGSMHLTPTLYNGGLSADLIFILQKLHDEGYRNFFIAGYSLGGNIVLKAAAELGSTKSQLLSGAAAVSPSVDLDASVGRLEVGGINRLYDLWFLHTLKKKIKEKAAVHPERYDVAHLQKIKTLRQFDDIYTGPAAGYRDAADYYSQASSIKIARNIRVPTLIIASEDDPLIPISHFRSPEMHNECIQLLATKYGGHAGYIHHEWEAPPVLDRFWAENRVVAFCQEVAKTATIM